MGDVLTAARWWTRENIAAAVKGQRDNRDAVQHRRQLRDQQRYRDEWNASAPDPEEPPHAA